MLCDMLGYCLDAAFNVCRIEGNSDILLVSANYKYRYMHKLLRVMLDLIFGSIPRKRYPQKRRIRPNAKADAASLEIVPELRKSSWKVLSREFSQKMAPYLTGHKEEFISQVCEEAREIVIAGYRSDKLAEAFHKKFGITQVEAELLATQATSLYMALIRKFRFKELGIIQYRWQTAGDQRVCDNCARLNGKVYYYDQPPILNQVTGLRANPGECSAYSGLDESCCAQGCRCIDIPILSPITDSGGI